MYVLFAVVTYWKYRIRQNGIEKFANFVIIYLQQMHKKLHMFQIRLSAMYGLIKKSITSLNVRNSNFSLHRLNLIAKLSLLTYWLFGELR